MALFRYGTIAESMRLPPERAEARDAYAIPGSRRTGVAAQALLDWLWLYDRGGFDALFPKPRADRGRVRRKPPHC